MQHAFFVKSSHVDSLKSAMEHREYPFLKISQPEYFQLQERPHACFLMLLYSLHNTNNERFTPEKNVLHSGRMFETNLHLIREYHCLHRPVRRETGLTPHTFIANSFVFFIVIVHFYITMKFEYGNRIVFYCLVHHG